MKGFVRVFESIIASIILISSLTFFFTQNVQESGWDSTSLQIMVQDALQTAYLNGTIERAVRTNNISAINAHMSRVLPNTVDYSINVRGIPNYIIRVVCADCSESDSKELDYIFAPLDFEYNGRPISIRIMKLDLTFEDIPEDTNTLFFFDKSKIAVYESKISSFMASGKSVFLLDDVDAADMNGPIGRIFNISWNPHTNPIPKFISIHDGSRPSHNIARYYANLSGKSLDDVVNDTFPLRSNNVSTSFDSRDVVTHYGLLSNMSFMRANYQVNGSDDRAIWSADYDRSDHNNSDTKKADRLMKAALMWASGEQYSMDMTLKTPPKVHFKSEIIIYDTDTYVFELTIWRAFF